MASRIVRAGWALVPAIVLGLSAGCGPAGGTSGAAYTEEAFNQNSLNELGDLLRAHQQSKPGAPTGLKDVESFQNAWPTGFQAIKDGTVVVLWGAPVKPGTTDVVLAYEKQTPDSGGYVLMQDAMTVKKMTADQFKSATKAATVPAEAKK